MERERETVTRNLYKFVLRHDNSQKPEFAACFSCKYLLVSSVVEPEPRNRNFLPCGTDTEPEPYGNL